MKTTIRMKVFIGSVSVLLGGVILASAADVGTNYIMNAHFTGNTPELAIVDGVPLFSATDLMPGDFGVVMTDGSGKIEGVYNMIATNLALGPYTQARFVADINGNIRSIGKTAETRVRMHFNANGYAQDDAGTAMSGAKANITFLSTGGMVINSSSVTPTNEVDVVYLNSDGTTNFTDNFSPSASMYYASPVTRIVFSRHVSTLTTNAPANGTNYLTQDNTIGIAALYDLGTPLSTDTNTPITIGTNTFKTFPNEVDISWNPSSGWVTNYAGAIIDIAQQDAVIAAYHDANPDTTTTNGSSVTTTNYVSLLVSGLSDSSTNINLSLSNSWAEIDGTLRGRIKAGKYTQNLNGEVATLSEGHAVYTLINTTNGQYVTVQSFFNYDNLSTADFSDTLDARVVTLGKRLWLSGDGSFSGKGNMDPRNDTFRAHLRGVSWGRGSSANLKGATGLLVSDYQALTNVYEAIDVAAEPPASLLFTNVLTRYSVQTQSGSSTNEAFGSNAVLTVNNTFTVPVPPLFQTNIVPNGIKTFTASGRSFGQKVLPTDAINPDAQFNYNLLGPVNDDFAARIPIMGTSVTVTGSNEGATMEPGEPSIYGAGQASVWWTWTAPASGSVTIDTAGSDFDTMLGVYTGSSVSGLIQIAVDDDSGPGLQSEVVFSATAGTTYQIVVEGYGGSQGHIILNLQAPPAP